MDKATMTSDLGIPANAIALLEETLTRFSEVSDPEAEITRIHGVQAAFYCSFTDPGARLEATVDGTFVSVWVTDKNLTVDQINNVAKVAYHTLAMSEAVYKLAESVEEAG